MEIVVQLTHRGHTSLHKFDLDNGLLRIGRGWQNDLIISDPRANEDHLQVETDADGQLLVTDQQTTNGTYLRGKKISQSQMVPWGERLSVGKSQLQIHQVGAAVPAARNPSYWEQLRDNFSSPLTFAMIALLALGVYLGFDYLETISPYKVQRTLLKSIEFFTFILLWSLAWGALSKLIRGEFHLLAHACIGAIFFATGPLLNDITEFLAFNLQSQEFYQIASALLGGLLIFAGLLGALAFATRLKPMSRAIIASIPMLVVLATTLVIPKLDEKERDYGPKPLLVSRPAGMVFTNDISLEQFVERTDELFTIVAQEAAGAITEEAAGAY